MSGQATPPGWYHAQGDPPNTHRWWSGTEWIGDPQPIPTHPGIQDGFPAPPPARTGYAIGERYDDRSPLEWYKLAWSRYAEFSGRSRRKEYWWFTLINAIIGAAVAIPAIFLSDFENDEISVPSILLFIAVGIFLIAAIIPSLAVAIRRLHDTGRSGWWYLIGVIPIVSYIGSIVLIVFYFTDGQRTTNQWGVSPKY